MTKPTSRPFVSRASTIQEALATAAKLPKVISDAIQLWGEVEIVVRKRQVKRSTDQNKLQRKWMLEAEAQGDHIAEEYRGFCKLHFAVPILRWELPEFREKYDRIVKPLPYEAKLELMQEPLDFPCTRLMNKDQKTRYLDAVYQHFTGLGMRLTDPNLRGFKPGEYKEVA
ncbi:hypothetical protein [Halomonas sp. C22]|uniref:hypothetical protein n=1 Tax=Halomonas sp. C22 TaxID=2580567 RepID=UPI0011A21229|nr:hypothetical protein [Halomonas sp. C22]